MQFFSHICSNRLFTNLSQLTCFLLGIAGLNYGQSIVRAEPCPEATVQNLVADGYSFMEQGQHDRALKSFSDAIGKKTENLPARLGLAMIYADTQEHAETFGAFDHIVQIDPDHVFAWNGRGLAAFNMGNFEEALTSFLKATANQPINGFFYESLAWTHMCRGDFREALENAKLATLMYNQKGESSAYPLLIAYFSSLEAGDPKAAQRTLGYALSNKPPLNQWPHPIFDFLADSIKAPELISFVRDSAEETEAHTYIGLKLRSIGEFADAKAHLSWVTENGDQRVFEYTLAKALHGDRKLTAIVH